MEDSNRDPLEKITNAHLALIRNRDIMTRQLEKDMITEYSHKYSTINPSLNRWDYFSIIEGLLQNYFTLETDAREFVEWIVPLMTPRRLKSLRRDSDTFQERYVEIYFKRQRGT